MPLSTAQRNGLVAWLEASLGTGRKAIWADQTAPRPDKPFATLAVTSFDNRGGFQAEEREGATDDQRVHVRHLTHELSVQVFANDAVGSASAVQLLGAALQRLDLHSVRRALVQAGIRIQNVGTPRSLPVAQATRTEGRAQVDITLSVVETLTETVGHIAHVVADVELPPFAERELTVPALPEPEPEE